MRVSSRAQSCLATWLQGPGAGDSKTVHPLVLQFLGPDRERLDRLFNEQRCRGYSHAQTAVYPLLIPTVLIGCIIKLHASNWQGAVDRMLLGMVLLVGSLVLGWFTRYIPGGPSLMQWYASDLMVFLVATCGAALFDDHSGPLLWRFATGNSASEQIQRVGEVYSWMVSIGGLGWFAGYSLLWPAHPLHLSLVSLTVLFWYTFPIAAFEQDHVCNQLIPQMFLVATIHGFIVLGRMRVEFKEKLLSVNMDLVNKSSQNEQMQRKTLVSFCRHTVEAHMWLGADANRVVEDDQGNDSWLRRIWRRVDDHAGSGPLFFQDLLATEDNKKRFQAAVATSESEDGSGQVQLVPCRLNMYDPGMERSVQKDCDVFVIRSGSYSATDAWSWKFLVGLRTRAAEGSGETKHEPEADNLESAHPFERQASEVSHPESTSSSEGSSTEGSQPEIASQVASQRTVPASATSSAMLLEGLRQGLLDQGVALQVTRSLGKAEHWLIPSKQVDLGEDHPLGEGGFGCVTRGLYLGIPAAIKRPRFSETKFLSDSLNELRLLRYIRHPHIACFYGAVVSCRLQGSIALVMEFVDGPTLNTYIENLEVSAGSWCRYRILADTCLGIIYLHQSGSGIVHGDLKPGNIMIALAGVDPQAKIVDLGLSRRIESGSTFLGHSLRWSPPEVLDRHQSTRASDVFSFAYIICFCLSGQKPWEGWKKKELQQVARHQISPLTLDAALLEILEPMLQLDPKKRCRISRVQQIVAEISILECGRDPFAVGVAVLCPDRHSRSDALARSPAQLSL